MTAYEIYDQTIKSLPAGARLQIAKLILDELCLDEPDEVTAPERKGNIRDRAHLEELLLAGLSSGPGFEATPEYWQKKHSLLDGRHSNKALEDTSYLLLKNPVHCRCLVSSLENVRVRATGGSEGS